MFWFIGEKIQRLLEQPTFLPCSYLSILLSEDQYHSPHPPVLSTSSIPTKSKDFLSGQKVIMLVGFVERKQLNFFPKIECCSKGIFLSAADACILWWMKVKFDEWKKLDYQTEISLADNCRHLQNLLYSSVNIPEIFYEYFNQNIYKFVVRSVKICNVISSIQY